MRPRSLCHCTPSDTCTYILLVISHRTPPAHHPPTHFKAHTTVHHLTPASTQCSFCTEVALKMAHYDTVGLSYHICNLKKNETRKYRDAVCREWKLRFQPIAMDGNCFFESVSTAMAHCTPPLLIPATDLRHQIVEWLVDCQVRTLPPYTARRLRLTTQTRTPPYTTLF